MTSTTWSRSTGLSVPAERPLRPGPCYGRLAGGATHGDVHYVTALGIEALRCRNVSVRSDEAQCSGRMV